MPLDVDKHNTFGAAFDGFAASSLYVPTSVGPHCARAPYLRFCLRFEICSRRLVLRARSCLGILTMQTYSYFKRYPHDKPFYKLLVRRTRCVHTSSLPPLTRYASPPGRFVMVGGEARMWLKDSGAEGVLPPLPGCWKWRIRLSSGMQCTPIL